jgi:hypothetical protein
MAVVALGCKAVIAVLLLTAGGAKLADLAGFAATVRLFAPRRTGQRLLRGAALVIALGEIGSGAASLSSPRLGWLNLAVLAICASFVLVSVAGYGWHRGRSCRCFGALSARSFSLAAIARAALLTIAAVVAAVPVRAALISLGPPGRLGLLAAACLVSAAAFSAAAALGASRDSERGWA